MPQLLDRRQAMGLARAMLGEDRSAELESLSLLLGIETCPQACCCERSCILLHPHLGPHECSQGHLWSQGSADSRSSSVT